MRAGGADGAEPGGAPGRGGHGPRTLGTASPLVVLQSHTGWEAWKVCLRSETWRPDRLRRDRGGRGEGQRDRFRERQRETRRVRQRERYPGLKTESETASNPRRQKARRTRNSEAERERGESRGQKRAAAETEALARGDAGTRRERFGSVTVLPHLEDITSPLKKNKYKKGLDIKRRQILLSLEGAGRRWPG